MRSAFIESFLALIAAPRTDAAAAATTFSAPLDTGESATALRDAQGEALCAVALRTDAMAPQDTQAFHERLLRLAADTRFGQPAIGFIDSQRAAGLATRVPDEGLTDGAQLDAALEATRRAVTELSGRLNDDATPDLQALLSQEAAWLRI